MKRLFISRELTADSILVKELSKQFHLTGMSLIDFSPLAFEQPKAVFDWIFFYSKNGVKYFFEQLPPPYPLPQLAAMGTGTANALNEKSYQADFIGSGNPETVAQHFLAFAENQKVLFPQAQHSKQSIQTILGARIKSESLLVYSNRKKKELPPLLQNNDILVFTSPLNAAAFLDSFAITPEQIVISIGTSTTSFLEKSNIKKLIQAQTPNEQAILQAVYS